MLSPRNTDIPTTAPWAAPTPPGRGANVSTFKGDCRLLQYQPFRHPVKTALTQMGRGRAGQDPGKLPTPDLPALQDTDRTLARTVHERTHTAIGPEAPDRSSSPSAKPDTLSPTLPVTIGDTISLPWNQMELWFL